LVRAPETPGRPAEEPRAVDVLASILERAGVEVIFGLPGGAISPMHDALVDHPKIRTITTRQEAGAMFAACGYAQATGKLAVVLVTSGPGVLNAMTGLASALLDGLPVLLIAGEVPRSRFGKNALQEGSSYQLDIVRMAQSVTKLSAELSDPYSAPATLRHAIAIALGGRRGPVLLTLPVDVATTHITPPRISLDPHLELRLDADLVREAAAALRGAERPLLFVGAGTRWDGAPARVRALAERLQLPVMTSPKAKGVLPEDHPLSLGVFGFGAHPSTSDYLQGGIDVLLAVGTSLGEVATGGWSPLLAPTRHLIHVDAEARQIGKCYPTTIGIVGAAEPVLGAMLDEIGPGQVPARRFGIKRHDPAETLRQGPEGLISPQRALWELQRLMPRDTIWTLDIGEHMLFGIHHLEVRDPSQFVLQLGLGSMGSGLGAAMGVKLGHPKRPVVAVCGDGCFSMGLSDIGTAVREKIPFVVAVMNDERFGMVELGHSAIYGRTPSFRSGQASIAGLARSLGAEVHVIEHAGEIERLAKDLPFRNKPVVLDIRIDRFVKMPKNARFDFLSKATRKIRLVS
jgi:acetolactate synthase-1/2/3 large subunit